MNKIFKTAAILCSVLLLPFSAFATNGDNLIGIGPISRAMGGVGIAAPQDAISATFANPAAMCFTGCCDESQFDFAATLFSPTISGKVTIGGDFKPSTLDPKYAGFDPGSYENDADKKTYMVPAFGFTTGINEKLRFGLAAYGITGLGVDHSDSELSQGTIAADNTQLMILKVAPTLAYEVTGNLSIGAAIHVVNSTLDLTQGSSAAYGYGVQLGALYHKDSMHYGLTYLSPIAADHKNVFDLDQDGSVDDFELEAPQQLGLGIAYEPNESFLVEFNSKWINWSDASGYDDLDWDDQIVVAIGVEFKPIDSLSLRLGYNYAESQIDSHKNFSGGSTVNIQGKQVNTYGAETLRIIGFPAAVEQHVTVGLGYQVTPAVTVNLGYMHAFEESVTSTGTTPFGNEVEIEYEVSEDALDFSISWIF